MKKLLILLFSLLISLNSNANQFSFATTILIDQDGNYYTNSMTESVLATEPISLNRLLNQTIARKSIYPDMNIFFAAHQDVTFERVFALIKVLEQYGIEGINIIDYSKYLRNDLRITLGEINFESFDAKKIILKDAWIKNIAAKVKSVWRFLEHEEEEWTAEVSIVQDRNGNVKAVHIYDTNFGDDKKIMPFINSIERAVYKASPLPGSPDDSVFESEINYTFFAN